MADFTSVSPLPEKINKMLNCKILHEKIPILTGAKKFNEHSKEWEWEIILKCPKCEGEKYPCKPDIFEMTYEKVEE